MTAQENNDHPSLIVRYENAGTAAFVFGYALTVMRLARPLFVLTENGATVRTFTDIAHVESFLRGIKQECDRQHS